MRAVLRVLDRKDGERDAVLRSKVLEALHDHRAMIPADAVCAELRSPPRSPAKQSYGCNSASARRARRLCSQRVRPSAVPITSAETAVVTVPSA